MGARLEVLYSLAFIVVLLYVVSAEPKASPQETVYNYVKLHGPQTFRQPAGYLKFPYIVPAGPYNQLWDWDSVFTGLALLDFGSQDYLLGSMRNFLSHTNLTTGEIPGCLTPTGPLPTIEHAKPILIQAAWIISNAQNRTEEFKSLAPAMEAFLQYFDRERRDDPTGLYRWWDQLESGADNLVTSECPSHYSPHCWVPTINRTLASADIMSFLYREWVAYSKFQKAWGIPNTKSIEKANEVAHSLQMLWNGDYYIAYNTSTRQYIRNRVYLMCLPIFSGVMTRDQADRCRKQISESDMFTRFGIRSTSSADPRYSNKNEIDPYSNWRGPIWINANVMLAYGFAEFPEHKDFAMSIAEAIVNLLAMDITRTGTWHEGYNSDTGSGLAAPGFLSWNTLGASLLPNLQKGINPFRL